MKISETGDSETTIQELKDMVDKFSKDRNWQRHHTPKNLSMSIAIEAAELMEHFQWERDGKPDASEVADELADIIFNCLVFAINQNIDITASFKSKYKRIVKKYPVSMFHKGNDSREDYDRIKRAYRGKQK